MINPITTYCERYVKKPVRIFVIILESHEWQVRLVDLDNTNCAPSFLRSLCEIGGDCFGQGYFSEGAQLHKKNTPVQNNHQRIHTMTETKIVQSYYW